MIILISMLASLLSWSNVKNFDLFFGAQGRTLPAIGAEVYAESGYNQLLWGKKETSKDVLYGLIRPSLNVSSSAVINSTKAELEFFPISFLGLSVGRQYIHSNYEFPFFDCDQVECKGTYERNWFEAKMALGHGGWVVVGNYKIDNLTGPSDDKPMADWRNVIVGAPGKDVQIDKKLVVAKMFGPHMAGVLIESTLFLESRERRESFAAVYQYKHNDTQYMFGAGPFHTDQHPMGLIFYFRIHHVALPTKKLF